MKKSLSIYVLCFAAMLMAHIATAQRYYAPLPLGQSVFDTNLSVPIAVQYYLPKWSIGCAKRAPGWSFMSDIPDSVCLVRSSFYTKTGYDRGHMMAAADRSFDLGVMRSTFVMSNVAPQTPKLNRGDWAKAESEVRALAVSHGEVQVFNAPIFFLQDTAWIADGRVAVPHGFLKIAMSANCDTVYQYWFFLNK